MAYHVGLHGPLPVHAFERFRQVRQGIVEELLEFVRSRFQFPPVKSSRLVRYALADVVEFFPGGHM